MAAPQSKNLQTGRAGMSIVVVTQNGTTSNQVRQALKTLGFSQISAAASHVQGLDRIKSRNFSMVFFDAEDSDMPALEFVQAVAELEDGSTMIALSAQPRVDDVFSLLRSGARGFLVIPFTVDAMEDIITRAKEGPPLSDAVLNAPDRNAALVGVILNNLYRVSVLMRQAREFSSAARELERQSYGLAESVDLARLFCEGGDEQLVEKIVDACLARAPLTADNYQFLYRKGHVRRTSSQMRRPHSLASAGKIPPAYSAAHSRL